MSNKCLTEIISDIGLLADGECACTKEQESGEDYTMCKTCMAGHSYERIADIARDEYKELFGGH